MTTNNDYCDCNYCQRDIGYLKKQDKDFSIYKKCQNTLENLIHKDYNCQCEIKGMLCYSGKCTIDTDFLIQDVVTKDFFKVNYENIEDDAILYSIFVKQQTKPTRYQSAQIYRECTYPKIATVFCNTCGNYITSKVHTMSNIYCKCVDVPRIINDKVKLKQLDHYCKYCKRLFCIFTGVLCSVCNCKECLKNKFVCLRCDEFKENLMKKADIYALEFVINRYGNNWYIQDKNSILEDLNDLEWGSFYFHICEAIDRLFNNTENDLHQTVKKMGYRISELEECLKNIVLSLQKIK